MLKELSKPEVQKIYTTNEIADILNISAARVRNLVNYYHIEHSIAPTGNSRAAYYSYDTMRQIKDIFESMQKKQDKERIKKQLAALNCESEEELKNLHPLVTDPRCLKLSWWPDVIPNCFEEV